MVNEHKTKEVQLTSKDQLKSPVFQVGLQL